MTRILIVDGPGRSVTLALIAALRAQQLDAVMAEAKPHWATTEARNDIVPLQSISASVPRRRTAQWKSERQGRRS